MPSTLAAFPFWQKLRLSYQPYNLSFDKGIPKTSFARKAAFQKGAQLPTSCYAGVGLCEIVYCKVFEDVLLMLLY